MRRLGPVGMTSFLLLTMACTGNAPPTASQSKRASTTAPSQQTTDSVTATAPPAIGAMAACGTRKGTPYFKAPLVTGVPETFVIHVAAATTSGSLCYSVIVSNPSAFPELQLCTTVGRALNGPLRLNSGQLIWLAEPNGVTSTVPSPCYIPYG
jgi:hypothetical protein